MGIFNVSKVLEHIGFVEKSRFGQSENIELGIPVVQKRAQSVERIVHPGMVIIQTLCQLFIFIG